MSVIFGVSGGVFRQWGRLTDIVNVLSMALFAMVINLIAITPTAVWANPDPNVATDTSPCVGATCGQDLAVTDNPDLVEACAIDMIVVVDETGSIGLTGMPLVEAGVQGLYDALSAAVGESSMALMMFGAWVDAGEATASYSNFFEANGAGNQPIIDDFIAAYDPRDHVGDYRVATNWDDALYETYHTMLPRESQLADGKVELVVFVSDGAPNASHHHEPYQNPGFYQQVWTSHEPIPNVLDDEMRDHNIEEANLIKATSTKLIGYALSTSGTWRTAEFELIAGPEYYDPANPSIETADIVAGSFENFEADLTAIVQEACADNAGVTLVKQVINDNGGTAGVDAFGITSSEPDAPIWTSTVSGSTTTYTSQQFAPVVEDENGNPIPFTMSEIDVAGYAEGTWSCVYDSGTNAGLAVPMQGTSFDAGSVQLNPGDEVTCTIVNDDIPSSIGDSIWLDEDGDGIQDAGEDGIANVTVYLCEAGVSPCDATTAIATTTSDANGDYIFDDVPPGDYTVAVDTSTLPTGLTNQTGDPDSTLDSQSTITLNAGEDIDIVDFGYNYSTTDETDTNTGTGAIGDRIWNDADGDGIQDEGELGIEGVTVLLAEVETVIDGAIDLNGDGVIDASDSGTVLDDNGDPLDIINGQIDLDGDGSITAADDGTLNGVTVIDGQLDVNGDGVIDGSDDGTAEIPIATTTTDSTGNYAFDDLDPGVYTLTVTDDNNVLTGYTQTGDPDHFGSTDTSAAANDGTTTSPIVLAPGDVVVNTDFGYQNTSLADVSGTVYLDADGDGTNDIGTGSDAGVEGVTVNLVETYDIIDGQIDVNGDGVIDGNDDGTVDGINVIDGQLDVNGDGVIDGNDDGSVGGVTVIDGEVDINGDGVIDATDDGTLGIIVATTTTDENGDYTFTDVPAGDYNVVVGDTANVLEGLSQSGDPDAVLDDQTSVTVGGTDVTDLDFGYTPPGQNSDTGLIGDNIYLDADGDGTQDADEAGLEGVTVNLYDDLDGDGVLDPGEPIIATATTNENGSYYFGGLDPNAHYIVEIETSTLPNGGTGLTNTDDPDGGGDSTSAVDLGASGGIDLDQDFGYVASTPNTIGGTVWEDTDGNGTLDETGAGLEGVTVDLYEAAGIIDGGVDVNGDGVVDGNDDGTFGGIAVIDGAFDVNGDGVIDANDDGSINGYDIIDGQVDYNGDGAIDGSDDGTLLGDLVGTTTTDANGDYSFEGLPDGTYAIDVTDENNVLGGMWHSDGPNDGADNNSQDDPYLINVSGGTTDSTGDFGYYVDPGSVGDTVFYDYDGDGVQDTGEPGISGVTVEMTISYPDGSTVTLVTVTDANGVYSFDNLLADEDYNGNTGDGSTEPTYTVSVDMTQDALIGYASTEDGSGATADSSETQGSGVDGDADMVSGTSAYPEQGTTDDTNDFGVQSVVQLGDFVWEDVDGDGIQDAGEPGIAGVVVTLTGTDLFGNAVSLTTTTSDGTTDVDGDGTIDPAGSYIFNNVPFSTTPYTITFDTSGLADTWEATVVDNETGPDGDGDGSVFDPEGGGGDNDASRSGSGETDVDVLLTQGVSDFSIDAGFYRPTSIAGELFADDPVNGTQDAGDGTVDGVATLYRWDDTNNDGTVDPDELTFVDQQTTVGGAYLFTLVDGEQPLPPGNYIVGIDPTSGSYDTATATAQDVGDPDPTDTSQDIANDSDVYVDDAAIDGEADGEFLTNVFVLESGDQVTDVDAGFTITPNPATVVGVRAQGGKVSFRTASEAAVMAYDVYRWDSSTKEYSLVNSELVMADPGAGAGTTYEILDPAGKPGDRYVVVEIGVLGQEIVHGPFTASGEAWDASPAERYQARQAARKSTGSKLTDSKSTGSKSAGSVRAAAGPSARGAVSSAAPSRNGRPRGRGASTSWAKGTVTEDGVVYVSAQELATAWGISESDTQKSIRDNAVMVTNRGNAIGWWAPKGGAGLYFEGEAIDLATTDENVYWIGRGEGKLAGSLKSGAAPAPFYGGLYSETSEAEEQVYGMLWLEDDPNADYWRWSISWSGAATQSFAIAANDPASGTASLEVRLQGATFTPSGGHRMGVKVNGTQVGTASWLDREMFVGSFTFDSSLLSNANTIELVFEGSSGSVVYVDGFTLSYPRALRAIGDRLRFTALADGVATVEGFSAGAVEAFASDGGDLVHLGKTRITEEADGSFSVTVPTVAGATYDLSTVSSAKRLSDLRTDAPSKIKTSDGAEYVVVATPETRSAAEALANLRSSKYSTMVVDLEEVYDEFAFGLSDVESLASLAEHGYSGWSEKLKYVVLMGTGSHDPKNYTGRTDHLIPARFVPTPNGLAASDIGLGDVTGNGSPEVIFSRIPAETGLEAQSYVDKLIAYENGGGAWESSAIFLSDNADQAGIYPMDTDVLVDQLSGIKTTSHISLGDLDTATARSQISTEWYVGASWVNFQGHGGIDRFASEGMVMSTDVPGFGNGDRLPIVASLTCVVGNFSWPSLTTLGEQLVMEPTGGAIGLWSPSGLSYSHPAHVMNQKLLNAAFGHGPVELGEAVKTTLDQSNGEVFDFMLKIYNLLGDPAVEVR